MNLDKRHAADTLDDRPTNKNRGSRDSAAREADRRDSASDAARPKHVRGPRMSLERKLGVALLGCLLAVFCGVLTMRLTNFGGSEERVEIDLSSRTASLPQPNVPSPPSGERIPPRNTASLGAPLPPQTSGPSNGYASPSPPSGMTAATTPAPASAANALFNTAPPSGPAASPASGATAAMPTTAGNRYATSGDRYPPAAIPAGGVSPASGGASPYSVSPAGGTTTASTPAHPPIGTTPPLPPSGPVPPPSVSLPTTPTHSSSTNMATAAAVPPPATTALIASAPPTVAAPQSLPPRNIVPTATAATNEPRAIDAGATSAQPLTPSVAARNSAPAASSVGYSSSPTTAPAAPIAVAMSNHTAPPPSPNKTYVVQANDSFWSIAERVYGDGAYYRALFAYNNDRYPHAEDVHVGSVLDVPSVDELKRRFPTLTGSPSAPVATVAAVATASQPSPPAVAAPLATTTPAGARTYVVQPGDTLFDIARKQLGKATYWSEIYNLNRAALGDSLESLPPGTQLLLPTVSP